ncbi:MAG: glycerol-3-phosphate 1-O-acyltransferase PlsY [Bacteroidetes bacterium]|nr:glycerol-3-phosphate 1-O-acyltransferase PlsY [Bacteroidota bacterium]
MMMILISILLAYLMGSVPTAVWVGRLFYDIDVRTQGSGNAGATNTIRVLGVKAGIPVMIVDVLKGYFAVWLVPHLVEFSPDDNSKPYVLLLASVAVVLGHTFPVLAGFRGGKGVASILGVGFALFPFSALCAVIVFLLVFITTRYVSLSSLTAGICFPLFVNFLFPTDHWVFQALSIGVAVFLPLTHRKNIERLVKGTESKISFRKKPGIEGVNKKSEN